MKILFILISLLTFVGCSNLSKNMISNGELKIRGGKYKTSRWEKELVFKRVSWFQELTLLHDILIAEVEFNGPFYKNWFSPFERGEISKCNKFFIVLSYFLDSEKISYEMFSTEMNKNGFVSVFIPTFRSHLKNHPDYEGLSFKYYKIESYCRTSKGFTSLIFQYPSFNEYILK